MFPHWPPAWDRPAAVSGSSLTYSCCVWSYLTSIFCFLVLTELLQYCIWVLADLLLQADLQLLYISGCKLTYSCCTYLDVSWPTAALSALLLTCCHRIWLLADFYLLYQYWLAPAAVSVSRLIYGWCISGLTAGVAVSQLTSCWCTRVLSDIPLPCQCSGWASNAASIPWLASRFIYLCPNY